MKTVWKHNRIDHYGGYSLIYSVLADLFCIWNGLILVKTFSVSQYNEAVEVIKKMSGVDKPRNELFPSRIPAAELDLNGTILMGNIDGENTISGLNVAPTESSSPDLTSSDLTSSPTDTDTLISNIESDSMDLDNAIEG